MIWALLVLCPMLHYIGPFPVCQCNMFFVLDPVSKKISIRVDNVRRSICVCVCVSVLLRISVTLGWMRSSSRSTTPREPCRSSRNTRGTRSWRRKVKERERDILGCAAICRCSRGTTACYMRLLALFCQHTVVILAFFLACLIPPVLIIMMDEKLTGIAAFFGRSDLISNG